MPPDARHSGRGRTEAARASLAVAALALLAGPAAALGRGGAFRESAHGDPGRGVLRVPEAPRGACAHCHSRGPGGAAATHGGRPREGAGEADALCLECHGERRRGGSFQGEATYAESAHALSSAVSWPARKGRAVPGACLNCHDPHGVKDAEGLVPALLRARGAALCLTCHDGAPAKDVATALSRAYRHPLLGDDAEARADASSEGTPKPRVRLSGAGACSACHNPHRARPGGLLGTGPAGALAGVARVRVSNGAAGAAPELTLLPADDPSPAEEHEVCFKCHSGFARLPPRLAEVALELNPANASYHPVEARGRNAGLDPRAFAAGWSWERRVGCSDCHSADAEGARGPHGSAHEHLLARRYVASLARERPQEDDLCFACHAFAAYAGSAAGAAATWTRFPGHGSHAARGVGCFACHDAHGSATLPALLALRSPGLRAYVSAPDGGTCTSSCHVKAPPVAAYRLSHAR